jgi:hypothetical protein
MDSGGTYTMQNFGGPVLINLTNLSLESKIITASTVNYTGIILRVYRNGVFVGTLSSIYGAPGSPTTYLPVNFVYAQRSGYVLIDEDAPVGLNTYIVKAEPNGSTAGVEGSFTGTFSAIELPLI